MVAASATRGHLHPFGLLWRIITHQHFIHFQLPAVGVVGVPHPHPPAPLAWGRGLAWPLALFTGGLNKGCKSPTTCGGARCLPGCEPGVQLISKWLTELAPKVWGGRTEADRVETTRMRSRLAAGLGGG